MVWRIWLLGPSYSSRLPLSVRDEHLPGVTYSTYLRHFSETDGTNHSLNATFLMHWRGNLAQSPRSSAPSSKSDDLCCKLHLMYCGVPNPLDSLCREAAAVAQLLHDLAFRVEALSIKALLILKASCVWCRFRGCAGEPIINSSSISILQAT